MRSGGWRRCSPAPRFLITYYQWDYDTLPAQARQFHQALERAGAASELVFIPKQNHISEMVNINKPDDPTAAAILRLIRQPEGRVTFGVLCRNSTW